MKVQKTVKIDMKKAIQKAKGIVAKVGFFDTTSYKDGTSVAQVAIKNEYGNPSKGQPPRPFMRPAMEKANEWKAIFLSASKTAWKTGNFKQPFELVSMSVQGTIKKNIATLTSPALAESTINARKARSSSKKPKDSITKPLVDSGYMLSQVTYEVTG